MQINHKKQGGGNKLKYLAMSLVGSGLLVFGLIGLILLPKRAPSLKSTSSVSIPPAVVEFPAPELQLHDIESQPVSLTDYRGQVVLVNNWATWCPPCREEMPILNEYFRDHHHQNFVIVAINAGDSVTMVSDFVARYGLDFPVWIDPGSSALNSFRNNYLPSSYLVNTEGQVIKAWSGAVTQASLEEHITPLLKE